MSYWAKAKKRDRGEISQDCTHKMRLVTSSYGAICHKISWDAKAAGAEWLNGSSTGYFEGNDTYHSRNHSCFYPAGILQCGTKNKWMFLQGTGSLAGRNSSSCLKTHGRCLMSQALQLVNIKHKYILFSHSSVTQLMSTYVHILIKKFKFLITPVFCINSPWQPDNVLCGCRDECWWSVCQSAVISCVCGCPSLTLTATNVTRTHRKEKCPYKYKGSIIKHMCM